MSRHLSLEAAYRAAPVWLQNVLASLEGWRLARERYGRGYREIARETDTRWSVRGAELRNLQSRRLAAHLAAAANSAFWKTRFAEYGVNPFGADSFLELAKLPILSKSEVQQNSAAILNPQFEKAQLRSGHTSGTTGAGLKLWETQAAQRERWAVWWRFRAQFGLNRSLRSGHFGGRTIVPAEQTRPPFWRYNLPGHQLLLSAYHLNETSVTAYWRALDNWKVEWLHGYPSFLALFARLSRDRGLPKLRSLRWVTTAAENLLPSQRRSIESEFGVRIRQHYGQAESVANVSERLDGRLVVDEDFSFVEFHDADGGETKRIIGTNWSNPAFPLLRYDTGDIATPTLGACTPAGEWRSIRDLDGRREDYVVLSNGSRVGRLDHVFKDLERIAEAQVYQPSEGRVIFRVVKGAGYDEHHEELSLRREARDRLGPEIAIEIEYVSQIPKNRSGKLRFVVSDLARGSLEQP